MRYMYFIKNAPVTVIKCGEPLTIVPADVDAVSESTRVC